MLVAEPRRLAAVSLAHRVSHLMHDYPRGTVGYSIRFEDTTKPNTRIAYVTDGVMLRQLQEKSEEKGTVYILDEVHERSARTDVLVALLTEKIRNIRVILMSATADTQMLASYFLGLQVPFVITALRSRAYSVEIKYLPQKHPDYIEAALAAIKKILSDSQKTTAAPKPPCVPEIEQVLENPGKKTARSRAEKKARDPEAQEIDRIFSGCSKPPGEKEEAETLEKQTSTAESKRPPKVPRNGSVLVFLSGLEDIRDLERSLKILPQVETLRLHSSLSDADQRRIYRKREKPIRVILATNIAETSITIPDVRWVVDSGVQKLAYANNSASTLGIVRISRAAAKQRAGRAGRTGNGVCYRLYTKEAYAELSENTPAEILRSKTSGVVLLLLSLGRRPDTFPFLEAPPGEAVVSGMRELFVSGLVTKDQKITDLGKKAARLPLDPEVAAFFLHASRMGAPHTAAAVAAAISVSSSPFGSEMEKAEQAVAIFSSAEGEEKESDITKVASVILTALQVPGEKRRVLSETLNIPHRELQQEILVYKQLIGAAVRTTAQAAEIQAERAVEQIAEKVTEKVAEKVTADTKDGEGKRINISSSGSNRNHRKRRENRPDYTASALEAEIISPFVSGTGISPCSISPPDNGATDIAISGIISEPENRSHRMHNENGGMALIRNKTANILHKAASRAFAFNACASLPRSFAYHHPYSQSSVYVHPTSTMLRSRAGDRTLCCVRLIRTSRPYMAYGFPYWEAK